MGILSEIFVATPAAAKQYVIASLTDSQGHRKKYAPYRARGLTALDLSYLWAVVGDEGWNAEHHNFEVCGSAAMNLQTSLESAGLWQEVNKLHAMSLELGSPGLDWSADDTDSALYRFPDEYVSLLAELAGGDERKIAAKWRSRRKRNGGAQLSEIQSQNVIIALASFAEQVAGGKRKGLYLWTSL